MIHAENDALVSAARAQLERAGKTGLAYHDQARPTLAEIEAANRALFLAVRLQPLRPRIYIVHCSVFGTVTQVVAARTRGVDAIAETTLQHLLLDETVYAGKNPQWGITQLLLREANEKILLWNQISGGLISTIGTDHCDYTIEQKMLLA